MSGRRGRRARESVDAGQFAVVVRHDLLAAADELGSRSSWTSPIAEAMSLLMERRAKSRSDLELPQRLPCLTALAKPLACAMPW